MIFKHYLKLANVKDLYVKDQLQCLKEIIKASVINFPFHNITTFGAVLPQQRKPPSYGRILQCSLQGQGGLCIQLNHPMKLLLETIGYQTQYVSGCFVRTGFPHSHCLFTVKIPHYAVKDPSFRSTKRDKTYLVDVGCGVPLHEPVDFDELPITRRAGGLQYRYERVNDNTLQRVHESGDAILGEKPASFKSPQDYVVDLTPRTLPDYLPAAIAGYKTPSRLFFHHSLYSFRYVSISEDDFEVIYVYGTDLIFITKNTRTVQSFANYEQLKPSILKYFPMINPKDVELATKYYDIPYDEAVKMTGATAP